VPQGRPQAFPGRTDLGSDSVRRRDRARGRGPEAVGAGTLPGAPAFFFPGLATPGQAKALAAHRIARF
jgi:hypothetical protein